LRRLLDRLEGHWLNELASVDARRAAGAEDGIQAGSTASWLRARLRLGPGAGHGGVRTARAVFRGPLTRPGHGPDRRRTVAGSCQRGRSRHPGAARPHGRRGRTGAGGGGRPAGSTPAAAGAPAAGPGGRPGGGRGHGRPPTPPGGACGWRPPGGQARPGGPCWSPRPARSCWPPWSRWPARPAPPLPAAGPAAGRCPDRAGPPRLEVGGWRRPVGAAAAAGDGGPGQPPRPSWRRGGEAGWAGPWAPSPPAAGL
jgi:hypothetical protein